MRKLLSSETTSYDTVSLSSSLIDLYDESQLQDELIRYNDRREYYIYDTLEESGPPCYESFHTTPPPPSNTPVIETYLGRVSRSLVMNATERARIDGGGPASMGIWIVENDAGLRYE
jgi:hypothetical protein